MEKYIKELKSKGYEICYKHKPWLNNEIGRNGYFSTQCFDCHALNGIEKVNGKIRIKIGRWLAIFNNKSVSVWVYKDGKLFTRWTYGTMDAPLPTELIEGALKEVIADYKQKEFNNE